MQVKQRYAYLCLVCVFVLLVGYIAYRSSADYHSSWARGPGGSYVPYDPGPNHANKIGSNLNSYLDSTQLFLDTYELPHKYKSDLAVLYRGASILDPAPLLDVAKKQDSDGFGFEESEEEQHGYNLNCRMENCFDFTKCQGDFKVYVYPLDDNNVGPIYSEILESLYNSQYYTSDASKACLFIASVDTLDRDERSTDRYVLEAASRLKELPYWNGGKNHLIFNLYSGTWPDYREHELAFDVGHAALAKASMSESYYRRGFDISFPLFHAELAPRGGEPGALQARRVPPAERSHALVFKGKRYLTGIGSETRNALYHIHNGDDVLLLTTCKHGSGWQKMQDARCEHDNQEYDKYDYKVLLHNSTFCLVPRGRRLGSYRFLESLQAACIPVLLSNGWVLPFSEVIDWNKAVVWGDERLLLQVPSIVRSMSNSEVLAMRQQTQFLWQTYFSSIDKIVATTLNIMLERVQSHMARSGYIWNNVPGALAVDTHYTHLLHNLPFYHLQIGVPVSSSYTAVIYATDTSVIPSGSLYKLLATIAKSRYIHSVVVLWHCSVPPPLDRRWPVPDKLRVVVKQIYSVESRYTDHVEVTTDGVVLLDADVPVNVDEVDFMFSVWRQFPSRLVGLSARGHYWDESLDKWVYSSKLTNHYSIVLTEVAVIHRYYLHHYQWSMTAALATMLTQHPHCSSLLLNSFVSDITKLPPLKVTPRKRLQADPASTSPAGQSQTAYGSNSQSPAKTFEQRTACLNTIANEFGYMPLRRSYIKLDPNLYGDPVSIIRKKYRQIEHVFY